MAPENVTTAFTLPGHRIVENLGLVRGIVVRSRSLFGNVAGGFQTLFGGNITIYTRMCEQTRRESFEMMCDRADDAGANAIVGVAYDANDIMSGVTEVLCYGTAVRVEAATGET